jgi:hypothetical protein
LKTKQTGGWSGSFVHHSKIGSVTDREHVAFLNMWLERFIFCRPTLGPTSNMQCIAEILAMGHSVPLGKHLLGAVYQLLHQVMSKLSVGQPVGQLGRPWWFIQLWLNLYTHKAVTQDILNRSFPSYYT